MVESLQATSSQVKDSTPSSSILALMRHTSGRGCLRLQPSLCNSQTSMSSTLSQELVSFPITPDDESSEAGSDAGADDALLSIALLLLLNQQLAALTRPEEKQPAPAAETAADNKAARQVRWPHPAWQPWHAACLHLG